MEHTVWKYCSILSSTENNSVRIIQQMSCTFFWIKIASLAFLSKCEESVNTLFFYRWSWNSQKTIMYDDFKILHNHILLFIWILLSTHYITSIQFLYGLPLWPSYVLPSKKVGTSWFALVKYVNKSCGRVAI